MRSSLVLRAIDRAASFSSCAAGVRAGRGDRSIQGWPEDPPELCINRLLVASNGKQARSSAQVCSRVRRSKQKRVGAGKIVLPHERGPAPINHGELILIWLLCACKWIR
jgi:hypothetical protein